MKRRGRMTIKEIAGLVCESLKLDEGAPSVLALMASKRGSDGVYAYTCSFDLRMVDRLRVLVSGRLSHTMALKGPERFRVSAVADRWQVKPPEFIERMGA